MSTTSMTIRAGCSMRGTRDTTWGSACRRARPCVGARAPSFARGGRGSKRSGFHNVAAVGGEADEVVPSVSTAPPAADEVDVHVRYVYPGVRFSQGKVAVLRAPKTTPIVGGGADSNAAAAAESAPATVTGADVVAALHRDGVDVQRWRPRVALRHAPDIGSPIPDEADPSSGGDSAWRRRPVVPDFVGWRVLLDHDVVTFDADSVGLLVQLEDVLVSSNTVPAGDHLSKFGDPFSRKGGGQNSRRRRRKNKAVITDAPDDSSVTVDETAGLSDEPARLRAANYWRGDDTELLIEKSTKNAYAGAESDGVTARPKEDTGAGFFGIGIVKAKHEQNVGTLWRSAWQLGAGFLFTVATRFKYEASDTTQAYKQLPLFKYDEWGDFAENSPHGAPPSYPLPVHDRFITPIDVL
jgi:hypothetical protein